MPFDLAQLPASGARDGVDGFLRALKMATHEERGHFPVAGLHATFDEVYGVFRNAAASLSLDEQRALFFTTANETYRLGMGEHHV